jgi:hypothetical protein
MIFSPGCCDTNTTDENLYINAAAAGIITIDLSTYDAANITVLGPTTLAFSSTPSAGQEKRFILNLLNGSAAAFTQPTGARWAGSGSVGVAPTFVASGSEKVSYHIYNDGTTTFIDGSYIGRNA